MPLKPIKQSDLYDLYTVQYSSENPEWVKYNAPYFDAYQLISYEAFLQKTDVIDFYLSDDVRGIYIEDQLIGIVSRYWLDENTRWLEIGIVIYDDSYWSKGIGQKALMIWVDDTFQTYQVIEHVGLTTWSGNPGMMKLSEKIGMQLEGHLRKVRYYQGVYYDSLKYGVLREEFYHRL